MKTRLGMVLMITAGFAAMGCGGDHGGPIAPTTVMTPTEPAEPAIPQVAGTYTGTMSGSIDGVFYGPFGVSVTVTQSGDQVTMDGTAEGDVFFWVKPLTGTLSSDGVWTSNEVLEESPGGCGKRSNEEGRTVFGNGTLETHGSWDTELCGTIETEMTATRTST